MSHPLRPACEGAFARCASLLEPKRKTDSPAPARLRPEELLQLVGHYFLLVDENQVPGIVAASCSVSSRPMIARKGMRLVASRSMLHGTGRGSRRPRRNVAATNAARTSVATLLLTRRLRRASAPGAIPSAPTAAEATSSSPLTWRATRLGAVGPDRRWSRHGHLLDSDCPRASP
jgi:hypothetical protein